MNIMVIELPQSASEAPDGLSVFLWPPGITRIPKRINDCLGLLARETGIRGLDVFYCGNNSSRFRKIESKGFALNLSIVEGFLMRSRSRWLEGLRFHAI
jgi:hypothetical protein